ncbi:IS110 family transposase [Fictibacillus sp. NRS-1165]|uniref:IS110 family transposase n=1 Tax=Fictibacillus sp. NRS-1165 TaxID=3144463 RepID=UPI003D1FF738
MKFKMQDRQNQLIERISPQHLIVGIDIAQQTHVARAVNFRGKILGNPLTFENNEGGFSSLFQWIRKLQKEYQLTDVIIGMEPTGHYWINLSTWLFEQEIEVVTVNPYHVKRNKENRDNTQSKSDLKDALVIADMVKNGYYASIQPTSEKFEKLRVLMANRDTIIKRLVSTVNQINRWVDLVFPELREVFKNVTGKGAITTLRLFPTPQEIRALTPEDISSSWKKHMKRQPGLKKAAALFRVAQQSVGTESALDAHRFHLQQLLEEYDLTTTQLERVEETVRSVLDHIPYIENLRSINGLNTISIAGILGEAGDLSQFSHGNALLRHAGLHLVEASSGKWRGQTVISKRGRSRLRRFLYMATMNLINNNQEFKARHIYNVQERGMRRMKSLMKLIGKFARILVGMTKNQEVYNPEKIHLLQAA